ncbi:protein SENSITIVE TO PROTON RHIZOTOXICITY 1 [Lotus japonicus]|uniref:protein SENSITIVE TO PROTON RHIZOTOXICITY 1 n=1 Tax=Lotus japonicus TaxID=34305 RepID=UPI00258CF1D7|nr:protein SENSITIVE TO PROTON RHIZOTOXICITY 1 [Lotus japonicus]
MDPKGSLCANNWAGSSSSSDPPPFYGVRTEAPFKEFNQFPPTHSALPGESNKVPDQESYPPRDSSQASKLQDWDPSVMLNNLSFLEEKIHQLQDLVHLIVNKKCQPFAQPHELVTQEQQLVTADLTSIIVQLISTAGSLLPSVRHTLTNTNPLVSQLSQLRGMNLPFGPGSNIGNQMQPQNNSGSKLFDQSIQNDLPHNCEMEQNHNVEEHEHKDEEDVDDGENLPPGSYEILQLEKEEILAPHTHFCTICGKGFKRDANLRMHMRGHGDEYKTPAALAKPHKETGSEPKLIKRYSCPYTGCKRNKEHKKFQPLKTILCVKNHYKRTHCDKSYICSRCHTKKFSVIADLKTHEKHCGRDKWLCSCGTTFSRKDKLFGHIALFQGHTPAIPMDDAKGIGEQRDHCETKENSSRVGSMNFCFGSNPSSDQNGVQNIMDVKGDIDDPISYFSSLNFEGCNFGGFNEFSQPPFEDSEGSFSFLMSGSFNYAPKSGGEPCSDNL